MDKKLKKILSSINLVTTYATKLMELEKAHTSSNKDVYWVIFDKNFNPYWLVLDISEYGSPYNYDIYRVNKKSRMLNSNDNIGVLNLGVMKAKSSLDFLEITKSRFANKKIGSALVDLFEYIAYTRGAKRASGLSCAVNPDIITQAKLNNFYKHKNYNVKKQPHSSLSKITKKFNSDAIKAYAKNFITVKRENIIFKIHLPNGYKPVVAYKLATRKKQPVRYSLIAKDNGK